LIKQTLERQGFTEYEPSKLQIVGGNYSPGQAQELIAMVCSWLWLSGLAFAFGGEFIFGFLGMKDPSRLPWWYNYLVTNKGSCLVGLFVLNNIGNAFLSTGAFEVYLDGDLMYSKLGTGRAPSAEDVIHLLLENGVKKAKNLML
jgi:thioredoxin reductase-like selenoprotein T